MASTRIVAPVADTTVPKRNTAGKITKLPTCLVKDLGPEPISSIESCRSKFASIYGENARRRDSKLKELGLEQCVTDP